MNPTILARFMAKVAEDPESDCLLWIGARTSGGYGHMRVDGKTIGAHRLAYEHWIGPIPDGMEIDHVRSRGCRSRACVRPEHLEAVTRRENLVRGDTIPARNAAKVRCDAGHPLSEANTYVRKDRPGRQCRTCRQEAHRRHHEKVKRAAA